MLVRFSNANGCPTCTQTVDFAKIRAIGMLKADAANENSYYVRISFDNGDIYMARKNLTLAQATDYRNLLESYWYSSANVMSGGAHVQEECKPV